MLLLTDIGHDPDDAIALSYMIEHGIVPEAIIVTPGFGKQLTITQSILNLYGVKSDLFIPQYSPKNEDKYNPGKHKIFIEKMPFVECQIHTDKSFYTDKLLVIGPAAKLYDCECDEMYFQGGYSPNSINPLEKFKGMTEVQSFNPCGAKKEFNSLLESQSVKKKYYIGKNVCHGYTKADLDWSPKEPTVLKFFSLLEEGKAMHDVLAAQIMMNKDIGIWEQAKPTWVGIKMTTIPTTEEIYSLIGRKC